MGQKRLEKVLEAYRVSYDALNVKLCNFVFVQLLDRLVKLSLLEAPTEAAVDSLLDFDLDHFQSRNGLC